ncbi:MAG: SRPBCC family protein [Ilumatobacteraceae bacterium]
MILETWGATAEEHASPVVGDDLCPSARIVATRCITIAAPPEDVFPWLRQMGFGRAGWYSYDWIDNLGRKSATAIEPHGQTLTSGGVFPGGPADFDAVIVDPPRALVMRLAQKGRATKSTHFVLAYELRDCPEGTRLVTRMRARIDAFGGPIIEKLLLAPGDGIMLRRQLLNVAKRAEAARSIADNHCPGDPT